MATGGFWNGVCHSSQSAALDAYYSQQPLVISNGAAFRFEKQGITWIMQRYSLESNGSMLYSGQSVAPTTIFPTCDPAEPFLDGMTIGWGIGAAMVFAACVAWLKKAAK